MIAEEIVLRSVFDQFFDQFSTSFASPAMSARDMSTPLAGDGGGASSTKTDSKDSSFNDTTSLNNNSNNGLSGGSDNLTDWIEQRQKSFWDFEKSFFQPFESRQSFPHQPQRLSLFSRPFFDQPPEAETDFFRGRPKMLSTRHSNDHGEEDMSPKAKVTYDEDKFQVKKSFGTISGKLILVLGLLSPGNG